MSYLVGVIAKKKRILAKSGGYGYPLINGRSESPTPEIIID